MVSRLITALAFCGAGAMAAAQPVDIDALKAKISERAGNYGALIDILEGADGNAALAAFDVMMESGNKTLAEMAVTSGLAASDARLRARALWEVLARRDSLVIEIDTDAVGENEAALAHLDKWSGRIQSWPLLQKFPETQCINLYGNDSCHAGRNVSVSGLKVDISYSAGGEAGLKGAFLLANDGVLRGTVASQRSPEHTYPASITLR